MKKQVVNPDSLFDSLSYGYSQAVKVGSTYYISGQISMDANGEVLHKGDIFGQARVAFENLQKALAEVGGTLNDIVKMTVYVVDIDYCAPFREVRSQFFTDYFPPNTLLIVKSLASPDWLIEMEAVAEIGS